MPKSPEDKQVEAVALRPVLAEKDGQPYTYRAGENLFLLDYEFERLELKGVVRSPNEQDNSGIVTLTVPAAPVSPITPPSSTNSIADSTLSADRPNPDANSESSPKLNLNSATLPELLSLSSLKAAQAKTIVENRPYQTTGQVAEALGLKGKALEQWNEDILPLVEV